MLTKVIVELHIFLKLDYYKKPAGAKQGLHLCQKKKKKKSQKVEKLFYIHNFHFTITWSTADHSTVNSK